MLRISFLILLSFLLTCSSLYAQNITSEEVSKLLANTNNARQLATDYIVTDAYENAKLGLKYVYLQQTYKGIKVHNAIQSMVFKKDSLQFQTNNFIADIAAKASSATPTLTAAKALNIAANHLGLAKPTQVTIIQNNLATNNKMVFSPSGIAKQNITTELVWVSNDNGKTVQLAWNNSIEVAESADYWNVRINAMNGEFISKDNYTVYENAPVNNRISTKKKEQNENAILSTEDHSPITKHVLFKNPPPSVNTATYNVIPYPYENRFVSNVAIENNPWTKAGIDNSATTYGWHFDGTSSYTYTRGNNVYVYDDSLAKNTPGRPASSTSPAPNLSFNFTPNFSLQPTDPINRLFATTNLFYWNNTIHDLYYQYGFIEAAGNFQNNNMNRGGLGGDYVVAEAQDGGGTNNANFSTPPDGLRGRMQMYLYNAVFNPLTIHKPSYIAGIDSFREAAVSPFNLLRKAGPVTGQVVYYNDDVAGTIHQGCALQPTNDVAGKIVFINSNSCRYALKIKNAQNAGAIAVIVGRTSGPALVMGGVDSSITIPAIMISSTDGNQIMAALDNNDTVNVTISAGVRFDGALDNDIIAHEYMHGITNRLTGGPSITSCLSNKEQGGEGWSDYSGLMLATDWANAKLTDGTKIRGHAQYASSQKPSGFGNRTLPYTTNMAINPHTYADLTNPLYNGQVHYIGEVWCSALWDMTWNIIQQEGTINSNLFNPAAGGGNAIALQLVVTALTLQKCKPGFLDSRDAILAADSILYGFKHKCAIWDAFARRGMGYSATQGLADSTNDQEPAFDVPTCALPIQLAGFKATSIGKGVQLAWNTITETNSKHFAIEYSTDGINWATLSTMLAKNTTSTNSYSYFHTQPAVGNNYYRLNMVDMNGSFTYSNIASIIIGNHGELSIYPNPIKDKLVVQWTNNKHEAGALIITDMEGKMLIQQSVNVQKGNNVLNINAQSLAKGTYLLMIKGANSIQQIFIKE